MPTYVHARMPACAAAAAAEHDWNALARDGQLTALTISELKVYLAKHKLKVSGNKADLVARIAEHMGLR